MGRLDLIYVKEESISETHSVDLVMNKETKEFFVRKVLSVYNRAVYEHLKSHPVRGIPRIEDLEEENGNLTVIEQWIPGENLEERLKTKGALPERQVGEISVRLCRILSSLHSMNPCIIHRDIKPSNVIVASSGAVYLLDMNAARPFTDKNRDTVLLGTQGYAAPEQYGFGSSDPRTDLYALGMLMNTLLRGNLSRDIFPGARLAPVIEKAIRLNPEDRFSSAEEMEKAILQLMDPVPEHKEPYQEKLRWNDFLPPGFRQGKFFHMLPATVYYGIVIISFFIGEAGSPEHPFTVAERILAALFLLVPVFCFTDYLGLCRIMPLCRSRKLIVRLLGKFLLTLAGEAILFIVLLIVLH
ncbi:MAG: serine/threonine protein kinase [Clostridia bacterium]|nr:serine/threonine protein kinase [Clostridia bacterium]